LFEYSRRACNKPAFVNIAHDLHGLYPEAFGYLDRIAVRELSQIVTYLVKQFIVDVFAGITAESAIDRLKNLSAMSAY
jgi:hypothetical protein